MTQGSLQQRADARDPARGSLFGDSLAARPVSSPLIEVDAV